MHMNMAMPTCAAHAPLTSATSEPGDLRFVMTEHFTTDMDVILHVWM